MSKPHEYLNSDATRFDADYLTCGGKRRDRQHGWNGIQSDLTVANVIDKQVGVRAFVMMGTTHRIGDLESLTFDIHGCRDYSKVKITLDPDDTYTVEFFKFRRFAITRHTTVPGVYADGLHQCIEHNTGLYLSL